MTTETWKDIAGYEGIYQISNKGNVRRLTFVNNVVSKSKIHPIKPTDNGNGYLIVGLKINGTRKNHYIHRLVADAFCPKRRGAKVVNHIDFDKYNNTADNLEWCTQKQNVQASSHRMNHAKSICKPTNTGEKYIRQRNGRYCLYIRRSGITLINKSFATLEDAIFYRDNFLREVGG